MFFEDCFIGILVIFLVLSLFINFLYLLGNLFLLILNSNSEYNFELITLFYGLFLYISTILFMLVFVSLITGIYTIIINIYSYIRNKLSYFFYERDLNKYTSDKN